MLPIDPIYFGWYKTLRILKNVILFTKLVRNKMHGKSRNYTCNVCEGEEVTDQEAEMMLYRYETKVIKKTLKSEKIKQFTEEDGILYHQGRHSAENPFRSEDLDEIPFLDFYVFSGKVPVILIDSPILYSLVMAVHTRIKPHSGIEISVKTISNKVKVVDNIRALLKRVKSDCTRCSLILKKTVGDESSPKSQNNVSSSILFYHDRYCIWISWSCLQEL